MDRKTVIVTGASQGIGAAIAHAYLREGFNVVANSRHIAYSSELQKSDQLLLVQGDVSDPDTGGFLVNAAVERFGSVDVLVNNAGQFNPKPFTSYTAADDAALAAVNINGFLLVTRAVIRHMVENKVRGNVITITASLAQQPLLSIPSAVPALTKGGLEAATRSLAIEYAARGIRFNVIAPGIVDTPMHEGTPREFLESLSPMGTISSADDIASAAVFLAGAGNITGEVLHVDGGAHAGRW